MPNKQHHSFPFRTALKFWLSCILPEQTILFFKSPYIEQTMTGVFLLPLEYCQVFIAIIHGDILGEVRVCSAV